MIKIQMLKWHLLGRRWAKFLAKFQVSCFVFLHLQKLLPSPLSSLFVLNSDCHQYLTRQKDNLHLHTHKYSFSLRVQGPQIWSDIPLSLRNSVTLSTYKHKLRDYFQSLKFKLSWTAIFFLPSNSFLYYFLQTIINCYVYFALYAIIILYML